MTKRRLIGSLLFQFLLSMGIPAFIVLFYSVDTIYYFVINILQILQLYAFVKSLEIIILMIFFIIIPLVITIYRYFNERQYLSNNTENKEFKELQKLFAYINDTINEKANRYYRYPEDGPDFMTYIQPEKQIVALKRAMTAYFRDVYNDSSIITDIFSVKDGNLKYEYADEPIVAHISIINKKNSTAKTVLRNKKSITIPDTTTRRARRMFVFDRTRDIRSIICYPSIENSDVKHIISVSSLKANILNKDNEEKNINALDEFAKRIRLEFYLKKTKEVH